MELTDPDDIVIVEQRSPPPKNTIPSWPFTQPSNIIPLTPPAGVADWEDDPSLQDVLVPHPKKRKLFKPFAEKNKKPREKDSLESSENS